MSQVDKGSYKLVAKNEKGEATSQVVEISDIPEEKGDKPQIIKHLRSLVSLRKCLDLNILLGRTWFINA